MSIISSSSYYTGNDGNLTETNIGDILVDKEVLFAPEYIEQIENKLILASTRGTNLNYCGFQAYASKIGTDIAYKAVILNDILAEPNVKNAKSTFLYTGFMPGEVESFAIAYLLDNGVITPSFHIPGKSTSNPTSSMKIYECDSLYLDVHTCSTETYWGRDIDGNNLTVKKIRHHRFPFRKDVNKPLYTTTSGITNTNKYRLRLVVTLNPAWTPGPIAYPQVSGNPAVISYGIQYKISGNPTINTLSRNLTDSDIGKTITLYDDVAQLVVVTTAYGELDTSSSLYTTYQTPGNERFILSFTYDTYVGSSSIDSDSSEIFGIQFFNIERPHPSVVGFFIVKNERLNEDRLIVDNAILGPMTSFQQFKSFGLLMPKQYYAASNCGKTGNAGKTLAYYNQGIYVFNPEFQFFNKRNDYDSIEIEGTYTEDVVTMPTISDTDGSTCNGGSGTTDKNGSKGVYINDVQSGTSYNPAVNKAKNKDDDGFDLIVGYRNTSLTYAITNSFALPSKKKVIYLNAAAYQNFEANTYYNVSVDN